MVKPYLDACESWTGDRPRTCMWRALWDEFVGRVVSLHRHCENGTLSWFAPDPSHREVQGLAHYEQVFARVELHADEERRAQERRR